MLPTTMPLEPTQPNSAARSPLSELLSSSEDEFYGSLQRIWNGVVQLEDMGFIHDEHDKFVYAYQFAEAELHRAFREHNPNSFGQRSVTDEALTA